MKHDIFIDKGLDQVKVQGFETKRLKKKSLHFKPEFTAQQQTKDTENKQIIQGGNKVK